MSFYSNNPNNIPASTRTFQARGKNTFNMSDGLQGLDLEFAKTALVIARSLSKLTSALRRYGLDNQAIGTEIRNRLRIDPGFAAQCVRISRAYRPDENKADEFEYYYLIAIPHEVLFEFLQHIVQYFKDPTQGIGPNLWVSKKSIEIYVALETDQPQWWDLKFLTRDQVRALPALVARTGTPPGIRSSNRLCTEFSYGSDQLSYHYQDGGEHMGWDSSQEPPTPEEMNEMAIREELEPYYQMPPDPIEMEEFLQGLAEAPWPSPPDPVGTEPDWQL